MIAAVIERCAGIDVGKKFPAVCFMTGPASSEGCTHVVMESTGCYWKPVLNILEDDPEYLTRRRKQMVRAAAEERNRENIDKTKPGYLFSME